jgi:hypothetical protein
LIQQKTMSCGIRADGLMAGAENSFRYSNNIDLSGSALAQLVPGSNRELDSVGLREAVAKLVYNAVL